MTDAREAGSPAIRTPDQRLRVFVSSTLRELESERRAVRTAIEALLLAPVMFELGARPHPPRDLYRSYLAQSDVFVGIYADSYGWVAPEEEISGLEDEYRLAPEGMPKLIYLREPANRQPRLEELIHRIQTDDTVSYKSFSTPEELADLVRADLAVLLAERFDAARGQRASPAPAGATSDVPSAFTRIIGRDREITEVAELLVSGRHRAVTLVGPGGIGKSRLAIAAAAAVRDAFPGGTVFVALENVLEPELVLPQIGYALGIRDSGDLPLAGRIAASVAGRRMLLILDNFEQVVDAAPRLVELFTSAPGVTLLVTSRTVLRIRGERVYDVPPLATVDPASPDSVARALRSPAVELLVERARAVKPDFEIGGHNEASVVALCRALEGVPLAIELAAARMRVLTPAGVLDRLARQLDVLSDAARDLPERQRTVQRTIDWSTGLLGEDERRMLRELAVFAASFTLDSVEAFAAERGWDFPVLDALERLVDSSLASASDADGFAVFALPVAVRETGVAALRELGAEDEVRAAHARVYASLAAEVGRRRGEVPAPDQTSRLNLERGNLRTAVRHLVAVGDATTAAEVTWPLFLYWWVGGFLEEVGLWMARVRDAGADARAGAIADFFVGWREMWERPTHETTRTLRAAGATFASLGDELGATMAIAAAGLAEANTPDPDLASAIGWLEEGAARFRTLGVGWGEALSLVALGRIALLTAPVASARERFESAVAAASAAGDPFTLSIALHHRGRTQVLTGEYDTAAGTFADAARISLDLHHDEGVAFALEGCAAIAAARGQTEIAGVLAGAAAAIRVRVSMHDASPFVYHTDYLARLPDAELLEASRARGAELGTAEAAAYVFDLAGRSAAIAETVALAAPPGP